MNEFFNPNGNTADVFDPARHNLVAVDRVTKVHFHVTLDEIARDAASVLNTSQPLTTSPPVAPAAPDTGRLSAIEASLSRERVNTDKSLQALVHLTDSLLQRVQVLEQTIVSLAEAAEKKLRERAA